MDELPRLISEVHWDPDLLQPRIAPGSYEEEQALAEIDAARDAEERQHADEPERRRRRLERYWEQHTPR